MALKHMTKEIRAHVSNIVRFLIIPAILGLLAGAVGGMFAFSYYLAGLSDVPIQAPGRPTFAVTAPLPETEIASRLQAMNLMVYPKRAATGTEGTRSTEIRWWHRERRVRGFCLHTARFGEP